jgi:hypothetical protein
MHYGPSASFTDPERGHQQASVVCVPRAGASLPGVKRVTRPYVLNTNRHALFSPDGRERSVTGTRK